MAKELKEETKQEGKIVSASESEELQKKGWVVIEIFVDEKTKAKMHKIQPPK